MQQTAVLSEAELAACASLLRKGSTNAVAGLSQMLGQPYSVRAISARRMPARETVNLVGGREKTVVGVYLAISGDASGHMLLMYKPQTAYSLVDCLMGNTPGTCTRLGEMEGSAIGEMGNIVGAFFLNALSDATGLNLQPSPPAVMLDRAGSIMDALTPHILESSDTAVVLETTFGAELTQATGAFFVLPTVSFIRALLSRGAR